MHDEVFAWLENLAAKDPDFADKVSAAIDLLAKEGPALPRPFVDTVRDSRHANMKELRPRGTGERQFRILFAFDPERRAICLVGGEKTGLWNRWYPKAIKTADKRYDEHLAKVKGGTR
jgi:hypothetical protein